MICNILDNANLSILKSETKFRDNPLMKLSRYYFQIFSGLYFPVFEPEKTPCLNIFNAVQISWFAKVINLEAFT